VTERQVTQARLVRPGNLPESQFQIQRAGRFEITNPQTDLQLSRATHDCGPFLGPASLPAIVSQKAARRWI
jgi:hypothetical protein